MEQQCLKADMLTVEIIGCGKCSAKDHEQAVNERMRIHTVHHSKFEIRMSDLTPIKEIFYIVQ